MLPGNGDKFGVTSPGDELTAIVQKLDPGVGQRLAETVADEAALDLVSDLAGGLDVRHGKVGRDAGTVQSPARHGE